MRERKMNSCELPFLAGLIDAMAITRSAGTNTSPPLERLLRHESFLGTNKRISIFY
jgi:hypothetical protein